jgi:two-component system, NtrC family, response regulator GlrR
MKRNNPHVLVVDDEADLCELLCLRLRHEGFQATSCGCGDEALALLESEQIDAVLLDFRLEEEDGLDVLSKILLRSADLPVIMLTAHGTPEAAVEAMKRGAYGFLTKPFDDRELILELRHAVDHGSLKREVAGLRRMLGGVSSHRLLGTSASIAEVRERITRAAGTEATVLILGESGTGKEVAARNLHELSARHDKPFIAINCGALPADLLESELFGHVRGAFTGAIREKEGLFLAADGGTLFLDEVGDAPPEVQVKLLRVIQERSFMPVGATVAKAADVRIVAATNRDLAQAVSEGSFREDLYYRLHVVPIKMPPLRERLEDIPILADVFLARANAQHHLGRPKLSDSATKFLLNHTWPGNVRELANVIEAAAVMSRDGIITVDRLEAVLPRSARDASKTSGSPPQSSSRFSAGQDLPTLREAKLAFEREYLTAAMERCQGNVSAAARMADRHRSDFHELLRRHGLIAADFREAHP